MPGRCFDQIRVSVAQTGLNVKMVASHGGISVGEDGISAQAIEDLSLMCSLNNVTVLVPADVVEARQAIALAARTDGPFYIRTGRPKIPVIYDDRYTMQLGKAHMLRDGADATIIACGLMVGRAVEAAEALEKNGVSCRVLNMSTLQPLDEDAALAAARDTGAIITAEEHEVRLGLYALVAGVLAKKRPTHMGCVGMKGRYAESGPWDKVLEKYGLTAEGIVTEVKATLARKASG
jgi:transketolase